MLTGKKAVIFDMDGSLIDSMWIWPEVDRIYMDKYHLTAPDTFHRDIEGMSYVETAQYFVDTFTTLNQTVEDVMQEWRDMTVELYATKVFPKAGAVEFLDLMKQNGIRLGIATSNDREIAEAALNGRGLTKYFDSVRTSSEVAAGKPAPDVYLKVADDMNVDPKNCLVFEDVINGILAGKNAGMEVCAVADDFTKADEAEKKAAADYFIRDFFDVLKTLTKGAELKNMNHDFLPVCREDMEKRGWKSVDFAYIIGDGYVDHPSFWSCDHQPSFRIKRISCRNYFSTGLERSGKYLYLRRTATGISCFCRKYGFDGKSLFCIEKRRRTDAYTPGGEMGKRPDHACVVYGNLIRQKYKKTAVIMGGIEASLRRMAHYDYWSDKLKRSILLDSGADIVSYGMGERSILEIAEALEAGIPIEEITYIDGTVVKIKEKEKIYDAQFLPSYEELKADRKMYAKSFYTQYLNTDAFSGKRLAEPYSEHLYVVQNPPSKPLSVTEMDDIYDLPYMRTYHPSYKAKGGIPAISEIRFSLISNRGCFGGCSFCALTFHQGRIVQVRSHESLIKRSGTNG